MTVTHARNVGTFRDEFGRPAKTSNVGIRVGPFRCDKRNPALVVGGVKHCPDCGREIRERWKVTDDRYPPEYRRSHIGLWSTTNEC